MNNGLDYNLVLDGLQDGIARGRDAYGIDAALILSVVRDLPVESAQTLLDAAAPRANELLAIGLDSAEVGYPPELFEQVYERAAGMGLHLVAHAGEEGPSEYIRQALDVLHVERIDHGVRIVDDPALVERVAAEGIGLTVCPLSSLRLQVVDDVANVPIRQLLDAGVRVTVNSDDPRISVDTSHATTRRSPKLDCRWRRSPPSRAIRSRHVSHLRKTRRRCAPSWIGGRRNTPICWCSFRRFMPDCRRNANAGTDGTGEIRGTSARYARRLLGQCARKENICM